MATRPSENQRKKIKKLSGDTIDAAFERMQKLLKDELPNVAAGDSLKENDSIYESINYIMEKINTFDLMAGVYTEKEILMLWDDCDRNTVAEYLKTLPYDEYLKTSWWKSVSNIKKSEINFCQLCASMEGLQTHHTTYSIIGKELSNMSHLTVLCDKCHDGYHKHIEPTLK